MFLFLFIFLANVISRFLGYASDSALVEFLALDDAVRFMESNQVECVMDRHDDQSEEREGVGPPLAPPPPSHPTPKRLKMIRKTIENT